MAFIRFRPTSHFIAPHSWMNDPCGAVYIPETQEYIVCYQWNPGTANGGNAAWGMAKSRDMVTWEDCSPPLRNGKSYDRLGVFSGSIISRIVDGRRVLFLFYTSVSALPIHWSKPYIKGCESQSVAFSTDLGTSWHRFQSNPLLTIPPKRAATTGWRDPFVSKWEALSTLLQVDPSTDYMMVASGERDRGPQLHIYQSDDLLKWKMISTILTAPAGSSISKTGKLKYGMNFECASFFSFGGRQYIIVGVEEDHSSKHHSSRYLLWVTGELVLQSGKPRFKIKSHGLLDHGILYAAHISTDSEGRTIQLGWADEDVKQHVVSEQGWAGCLALPRELYEISKPITSVCDHENLWDIDESSGAMTTLGIRPAPQVFTLRKDLRYDSLEKFSSILSTNFSVEATFKYLAGDERFIFKIRQCPNSTEATKITFDITAGLIIVDRSHSSLEDLGATSTDSGPFHLLPDEHLQIQIFVDNSIIEIYANDRFALTSRIYPSLETSIGASYDFGDFDEGHVEFRCWEGLKNAWPRRLAEETPGVEIVITLSTTFISPLLDRLYPNNDAQTHLDVVEFHVWQEIFGDPNRNEAFVF
ncbi:glycoside hydrolase family 32 protein [Stipitochalara longipes BDJ]|nr:glycoside hydrolase family 32 protein [Stipitochalara longipes BDJ]